MSERSAEEWGLVAVGLPGWRWMRGMATKTGTRLLSDPKKRDWPGYHDVTDIEYCAVACPVGTESDPLPDADDPATAGCLLALLGPCEVSCEPVELDSGPWSVMVGGTGVIPEHFRMASTLGRACIAVAEALGRWPGGEE